MFPNLKNQIFGEYSKGFYKLLIQKDDVHKTICENAEFLEYNKKVNKAFEEWKTFANPILSALNSSDSNKEIILKLSEEILEKFSKLELLDKYDVYQVLLAYWNETMNDDVLLIIQDELGYNLAKITDDIKEEPKESKKAKKDSAKEKKPKEPKIIGWEGRLIPKQIVLDAFFALEQKEIEKVFPNNTVLVANELILKRITLFKAENMITAYQIVDEIGKQINANDLNGITGTYTGTSVYDILY